MTGKRLVLVTQRFWPLVGNAQTAMAALAAETLRRGHRPIVLTAQWNRRWPERIVFRGVPEEDWSRSAGPELNLTGGSLDEWTSRMDAAILGETLARRRGLKVGDRIDAAGVKVYVAGIMDTDKPQEQNARQSNPSYRDHGKRPHGAVRTKRKPDVKYCCRGWARREGCSLVAQ